MTVSELYGQVAQLGFEDILEDDNRFYYAVNRALLQVSALRPAIEAYVLNHKPMENALSDASFSPTEKSDTDLIYEAEDVKAYYFEADGTGAAYIERLDSANSTWRIVGEVSFSNGKAFKASKGFIKDGADFFNGAVRIRFCGEYLYSVKCVAMYHSLYSADVADIPPYEAFTRYDMGVLVNDFLSLESPPVVDADGTRLSCGYEVESGRVILLPHEVRGVYKVLYRKKPTEIENSGDAGENNTEIVFDEEICSLLPLLVAAYIWIDDEPEKAQYYMNLYRERAAELERRTRSVAPVMMKNVYGW